MAGYPDIGAAGVHVIKGIGDGASQSTPFEQAVVDAGSLGVDHSANPPSLTGLDILLAIPVNLSRRGYILQNQDTVQLLAVFHDGAGGAKTVLPMAPAIEKGSQGGGYSWPGMPHLGAIDIYGPTGSQFGARDW